MNDPDRYKKLKVGRACDFCRRRKSKCDIGIPGSGTCSNCKKANQICIFSPVNSLATNNKVVSMQPNNTLSTEYQDKYPFFSMDHKAHCGYERDNIYAHTALASSNLNIGEPVYPKEIEQELFQVYFNHFHPYFPVLDKHYMLQSQRFDTIIIPYSLKLIIIAISLLLNNDSNAILYYQHALNQLDHTITLSTVQTLFLLYKYQEMVTPVGTPISSHTIGYLKEAQSILSRLPRLNHQETRNEEFISRAEWLLFIILTFGNLGDKRWRHVLDYCTIPIKKPELTEVEHYDKIELNTTCNLIYLVNLALVYSPTLCLISDKSTLFSHTETSYTVDFNHLATKLEQWKAALPRQFSIQSTELYPVDHSYFTVYLCYIHDILALLFALHQPTQQHDLSKMASSICYKAHCLTVGDMEPLRFSRLASIQGSRLVAFGITLALQTQSYCQQLQKNIESCYSLAFQIFDQLSLSPQLYMTMQTYRTQIDSEITEKHGFVTHGILDNNYSHSHSHSSRSFSTVDSHYYYNVSEPNPQLSHQEQNNNTNSEWQQYTSYTTHENYQLSWDTSYYQVPQDNMPITPTFQHSETNNLSPVIAIDSYFEDSFGSSLMVSTSPYHHHHSIDPIYYSKSCRTKKTI